MAVAVNTSGSQTATGGGTEDVLATVTSTPGIYILAVDTANMVDGDTVELRVYGKARSSNTERLIYRASFSHTQADPLKESVAVATPHHIKVSLTQSAGTGRAFPWALYSL